MTPTSQDRHAAVNAFANRVATYVTEEGDPEWSPYRCAVEAVTVAMQDAWYEVEAIGSPAVAPAPSPDPQTVREALDQEPCTAESTLCGGAGPADCWNHAAKDGRCYRLTQTEATMRAAYAVFGAGASPVPQPDPPSECVSVEHCRVDSLCGGSPEHCRIHDPCTCMSDAPDPECIIHGTSSHRTPLRAALAASPEPPEVNEHG